MDAASALPAHRALVVDLGSGPGFQAAALRLAAVSFSAFTIFQGGRGQGPTAWTVSCRSHAMPTAS